VQTAATFEGVGSAEYIIITSPELEEAAEPLASFYSARGISTALVSVDWIYENYLPAENITMYWGFYTFESIEWIYDPYYELLLENYNWTLALKIISFLRDQAAHPFLTHILLLGPSDEVPPSFYFLSYDNYYMVDAWNGWVPTDMFYMSPDYDLVPNYAVGRIPVDDPEQAAYVIRKIRDWHHNVSADETWFRKAFLSGGYPFGYIFMHGEAFVSKLLREGYVRKLNANAKYRTDHTYNKSSVSDCLSGGYGWAFMVAHGSGDAMADMLYNETLDEMRLEWLVDKWDLENLDTNPAVPIIMSVACMNGAWDEEILPPGWFWPPSFGEACLLSPAGGIAYIGASRVSWAMPFYNLTMGVLDVEDPLACQYLASILKAYNQSAGPTITLGEIFSKGLLNYMGVYYDLTTIMEFGLLGDPCLTLPVFDEPYEPERIRDVEITNSVAEIQVESIAPYLYYSGAAEGTIPYVSASQLAVEFRAEASEVATVKVDVTRVLGWDLGIHGWLAGHIAGPSVEVSAVEGVATGNVSLSFLTSGHLLLKVRSGQDEWRVFLISYGLQTSKPEAPSGSLLTLTGQGLDVLGPPGTEAMIEFGGNFIGYATLEKFGFRERRLIVPWAEPGSYNVTVYVRAAQYNGYLYLIPEPPPLPAAFTTQKVLLSGVLATIQNDLIKVQTDMGELTFRLEDLNATVFDIRGSVAYVNTTIGKISLSVEELKGAVSSAETAIITKIENETATVKLSIGEASAEIKASVEALQPRIVEVKNSTLILDSRLGRLATDLNAINGTITSIQGDVATVKTDVGAVKMTLEGWMGGATSPITTPTGTFGVPVLTNSTLEKPPTFSDNTIIICVSGPPETAGKTVVLLSKGLLEAVNSSIGRVEVTIDGRQAPFAYTEQAGCYVLTVSYTHSTHEIKVFLKGIPPSPLPIYLAVGIAAIAAIAGMAIYMLKIRKKRQIQA